MKIIASRGSGKTTFLIAFLNSLISKNIVKHEYIYIYIDYQTIWITSGFQCRNNDYLTKEHAHNKLLVFDDAQNDLKKNPIIQDLFIKGRHNKTGIIQCEQYTQNTATIRNANTDYFVLIPPFSQSTATYYHEKFILNLSPKNIEKVGNLWLDYESRENNNELRYLMVNKYGYITIGYKYCVCPFEDGEKYAIVKIKYNKDPIQD